MKAIMISDKPIWCKKILNKEKTLELRTTCPKEWKDFLSGKTNIKPKPIKVYIYCTKGKEYLVIDSFENDNGYWEVYTTYQNLNDRNDRTTTPVNGKVIAEFTLKQINKFSVFGNGSVQNWNCFDLEKSCLTYDEIADYIGYGKIGYAWHIDNLKIYDKPKELSECGIKRAFQSWGYISE